MNTLNEQWKKQVVNWEYSAAATPDLSAIPIQPFPASLHETGTTRVIELDISTMLGTSYPASSPCLLANYVHICSGESIQTHAQATSEVFFVMRGSGQTISDDGVITWQQGDAFTLPSNAGVRHEADSDTALYWTHDAPLLQYLGVSPSSPRFKPAFYGHAAMHSEVDALRDIAIRENRNRVGIILGNKDCIGTKTITHSMWALFNLLPAGAVQKAHRHNSVALDLAVSTGENTYTLIGQKVDAHGDIINPVKAVWEPNTVFITPPGWWHSHHNESDQDAYVFPVQDAGLHSYLRTLDIQFVR
ncbi:MAG: cupin domain-containing protein [Mariprofundaceae bacterium]|nr:cupin domain-containing protein [Mariprofundaceae bacterium]